MITFTNFKNAFSFSCLLAVCFFTLSSLNPLSAAPNPKATKYSGEELVRGILLLEGPAANAIPELRDLNLNALAGDPSISNAVHDFNSQIINQINQKDSKFIGSFEARITSGNHSQIRAALEEGRTVVTAAIQKVNGPTNGNLSPEAEAIAQDISSKMSSANLAEAASISREYVANKYKNDQNGSAAFSNYDVAIAIDTYAIAVAVSHYFRFWFWSEATANMQQNELYKEQLVNSIAKNL